jgi:hypothetical protein
MCDKVKEILRKFLHAHFSSGGNHGDRAFDAPGDSGAAAFSVYPFRKNIINDSFNDSLMSTCEDVRYRQKRTEKAVRAETADCSSSKRRELFSYGEKIFSHNASI